MRTWYRLARFDPIMFQLPFRMKNPCALVASKLQTAGCHPEFYAMFDCLAQILWGNLG
jgi:hypothetical protein